SDRYPLELEKELKRGSFRRGADGTGQAMFIAKPYSNVDFTFQAWLGDGRTRKPLRVRFVPRPVVTELTSWVLLPPYCDYEGKRRYPILQPRGDIVGIKGSMGKVQVKIQKPIASGFIEIRRIQPGDNPEKIEGPGQEIVHRTVNLELEVTAVDIADGGSNYREGDRLAIEGGTHLEVEEVTDSGAITEVKIVRAGV